MPVAGSTISVTSPAKAVVCCEPLRADGQRALETFARQQAGLYASEGWRALLACMGVTTQTLVARRGDKLVAAIDIGWQQDDLGPLVISLPHTPHSPVLSSDRAAEHILRCYVSNWARLQTGRDGCVRTFRTVPLDLPSPPYWLRTSATTLRRYAASRLSQTVCSPAAWSHALVGGEQRTAGLDALLRFAATHHHPRRSVARDSVERRLGAAVWIKFGAIAHVLALSVDVGHGWPHVLHAVAEDALQAGAQVIDLRLPDTLDMNVQALLHMPDVSIATVAPLSPGDWFF